MVLTEDDSILHPEIEPDCLLYVTSLNEGPQPYTRFFDALLIKRDLHTRFFRDLKAFREQPQLISVLENATTDKTLYKSTTLTYLGSRFAHPWCRKTPMKKAFWRAEWGTIDGKQKDSEIAKEEERLHKLLVPIWIIMRSKMFPGQETVTKWCVEERQRLKVKQEKRLTMQALKQHEESTKVNTWRIGGSAPERPTRPDRDSDDEDDEGEQQAAAAHAATSVLRLAAAGMIISQTPKRKLRWLTKS